MEPAIAPDTAPAPQISVVIPHLNQPAELARGLAALAAQADAPPFEAIVVDNGSAVLPETEVAAHPFARLLAEPEPGPGPARNRGAAAARAPVLGFIDADCRAAPGWLAAIWSRLGPEAPGRPEVLGGDVRIPREAPRTSALEAYESIYAYRMEHYIARQGFTGTGNLAMRAESFARVGPFAGIGVAEDRDWGRRAGALGLGLGYVPEMVVYHPARRSFTEYFAKIDRQMAHDFAELPRGAGARLRWAAKAAALALSPPAELPRILREDRVAGPRERALAIYALARIRAYRARRMLALLVAGDARRGAATWNR
ncbi:hypothetical protein LNKW23_35750 [Paralimibaculum aggregatum]|uniref:Glycosyltransferase 2-like domain-containing protein n=1 Tax=Paralimibaculum aggregatum TaxID=3036245 RepID=A0ABQ6LMD9_9RHOB|nr:glycosyltransferase [Limibaculum sp. NKW23]GMG84360.1 hypothetical protein LNKW23_35750 [Limibaculum sp. NKW23]